MVVQNIYSDDQKIIVIPSWASNKEVFNKILVHQQQKINPDAIFGRIDARNFLLELNQIFEMRGEMKNERESSARQWKDAEEFATPNVILNAQKKDYVIDIDNV